MRKIGNSKLTKAKLGTRIGITLGKKIPGTTVFERNKIRNSKIQPGYNRNTYYPIVSNGKRYYLEFDSDNLSIKILTPKTKEIGKFTADFNPFHETLNFSMDTWSILPKSFRGSGIASFALQLLENRIFSYPQATPRKLLGETRNKSILLLFLRNNYSLTKESFEKLRQLIAQKLRINPETITEQNLMQFLKDKRINESFPNYFTAKFSKTMAKLNDLHKFFGQNIEPEKKLPY